MYGLPNGVAGGPHARLVSTANLYARAPRRAPPSRAMLRGRMQRGLRRGGGEVLLATAKSVFGRLARGQLFAIEQVGALVRPSFCRQLLISTKPVGRKLRKGC
jgi:hypothetical protein